MRSAAAEAGSSGGSGLSRKGLRLFTDIETGIFRSRPNRFTVECILGRRPVRAYLPNPGRLWELLLPGSRLYLERDASARRRTRYTVLAVEKDGAPVLLHTHLANTVARWLVEQEMVPGLTGASVLRSEVPVGDSRFDLLLRKGRRRIVLEVKSCTLFSNGMAMFPDAVTLRGRRHLEGLARLSGGDTIGGVLFLVHSSRVRYFLPEYHTDPGFAETLCSLRDRLFIKAVTIGWDGSLLPDRNVRELSIPWRVVEAEAGDRGSYILVLQLKRSERLNVGGLGQIRFRRGYYLYVGSAMRGLRRRMERHRRRRKRLFWHVDHLRGYADLLSVLPVRSAQPLECDIAGALEEVSDWSVPGFGSSDCSCRSHLFGMRSDPLGSPVFIRTLLRFRMDRLQRMCERESEGA